MGSLFNVNLSLYFHTTESSLDLDKFFLCQTYSPSSKTSQQESDSQGHLWSSGLHHENNFLFYKYSCFSGGLKDNFRFHLPFLLSFPSSVPQRQMVPVAPRTRPAHRDEMTAAIQLVQEHLHSLAPQAYTPATLPQTRDPGMCRENRTNRENHISNNISSSGTRILFLCCLMFTLPF